VLNIKQCREIDGSLAHLTDDELIKVLSILYQLSGLAFDVWMKKRLDLEV